jgi:hypothetical protein
VLFNKNVILACPVRIKRMKTCKIALSLRRELQMKKEIRTNKAPTPVGPYSQGII